MSLADAVPVPPPAEKKPRRRAAAVAGIVGVGSVVGVGAWALQVWAAQGPQPAEALPGNTLAYVAVDLDPPGGQKVAAFNALRKFPSLKKELDLGNQDDLRRSLVDEATSDSGCDVDLDDLESWAGSRAALAVVPLKKPEVVAVVQIEDPEKAEAGLKKIAGSCDEFGFAVSDGWAVLAETGKIAEAVRTAAARSTLADDDDYTELVGAAGDAGVVTLFAAPEAGPALLDAADEDPFIAFSVVASPLTYADPVSSLMTYVNILQFEHSYGATDSDEGSDEGFPEPSPEEQALFDRMENYDDLTPAEQKELDAEFEALLEEQSGEDLPDGVEIPEVSPEEKALDERMENYDNLSPAEQKKLDDEMEAFYEEQYGDEEDFEFDGPELPDDLRKQLRDFSGLGGVLRFDDGSLELEAVGDPLLTGFGGRYDDTDAQRMIAGLPADTAVAFGGGFADDWGKEAVSGSGGVFGMGDTEEDLLAAFKKSTGLTPKDLEALGGDAVAFAGKAGFGKALNSGKTGSLPIAARVSGDPAAIEASLAKLRAALDPDTAKFIESRRTDDGVVIGPNAAYLEELVDPKETLGDSDRFQGVVPDADEAVTVTFADFDAGDWLDELAGPDGKELKSLDTAGLTITQDGDQNRFLLRVTLD